MFPIPPVTNKGGNQEVQTIRYDPTCKPQISQDETQFHSFGKINGKGGGSRLGPTPLH